MKRAAILRQLREFQPPVPLELAQKVADQYADEATMPTVNQLAEKALRKAAREKSKQQFRREYRVWCRGNGLPVPVFEHVFHPTRLWRLDIAWLDVEGNGGVYLENDGGAWTGGRHTRPQGFIEDQAKRNAAVSLGWRPLHCTPQSLYSDALLAKLKSLLQSPPHRPATTP